MAMRWVVKLRKVMGKGLRRIPWPGQASSKLLAVFIVPQCDAPTGIAAIAAAARLLSPGDTVIPIRI